MNNDFLSKIMVLRLMKGSGMNRRDRDTPLSKELEEMVKAFQRDQEMKRQCRERDQQQAHISGRRRE